MKQKLTLLIALMSLISLIIVTGDIEPPQGATIQSSSRHNTSGTYSTSDFGAPAQAGNVTYINISAEGSTKTWAAYYGNVSGTLVLENIVGNRIYEWSLASPGGKIFATETVVSDWSSVYCWNWSKAIATGVNYAEWNLNFSVGTSDVDSVERTFNGSYDYTDFYIAGRLFDASDPANQDGLDDLCPAVQLFNETGTADPTNGQYEEIILERYSPSATTNFEYYELIYMTMIESDGYGFDGTQIDFQMIVPEDGHAAAANTLTDYYFYVELEAS